MDENGRLKEINLNLQFELNSFKNKSISSNTAPTNITDNSLLTPDQLIAVERVAAGCGNKDLGKLVQEILLILYQKDELKNRTITDAEAKNPKNRGRKRIPLTPTKLDYIYGKSFFFSILVVMSREICCYIFWNMVEWTIKKIII